MRFSTIFMMLIFAHCVSGETNITGIVQGSFLLIDKVCEDGEKLRPTIDWVESPSGQKRPKDTKQIFDLINKSTRVFSIKSQSETNKIMYVIAASPFPRISGGISSMEDIIFISNNIVELELDKIPETEYRQRLSNLFVYRTNSSTGRKYHEPFNANEASALYESSLGYYVLKDIRSFTMTNPKACSDNWHNLYNRYKTKIIFKDN